ncbi:NAD(P)/FAD-dependent oxidoreductase [Sphingobium boeckii]|uniref:Glycine/D-amino acid oxidase-like deaminating enzyme n=1 Tax=Sphingobium boeckii TaxID=1082345 RepID=A0A7W9AJ83_9SPHN|nr:FAD-dependent oxidoreductase [Sphingobium boeckii]MBB5686486.1 glycine/D-amino acid oxidase-like deaminating enzyme [Sphingobium boeckii]
MELTEHHDLRGGVPAWRDSDWTPPPADPLPEGPCDIAIIGSGIMGSILAERLSADGHSIVLLDRRPSGHGSTAASTAELMWAMDVPLSHLSEKIGEAGAARRWRCVYQAVRGLAARIEDLGVDCDRGDRPTVYLAGDVLDETGLQHEAAFHARHDLPTRYLDADAVAARFGIAPRAALVSEGGFVVDPVKLAHGLLEIARQRGAKLCYPCNVTSVLTRDGTVLTLEDGRELNAKRVIFASGYERARVFLPPQFSLLSSFVMATPPGVAPLWREDAMIWEASDPYLYVRTTSDGRIIAGGEDEDFWDPLRRDALIEQKAGTIKAKVEAMLGCGPLSIDRQWAATFGSSPDGLPAIGPAAHMDEIWIAAGFGGNGIAFAALAADLLAAQFSGKPDPDLALFDPYRFGDE